MQMDAQVQFFSRAHRSLGWFHWFAYPYSPGVGASMEPTVQPRPSRPPASVKATAREALVRAAEALAAPAPPWTGTPDYTLGRTTDCGRR